LAINNHPDQGTILICQFEPGFRPPEMVKRRPVIVVSPRMAPRVGLCTVVALSTAEPRNPMPYHLKLQLQPALPPPWDAEDCWVKGDMVAAVGFHRLDFVRERTATGDRSYRHATLDAVQLRQVQACILMGLGLGRLTKSL
jgi:uncharacterized protein YifN (PemK superfamily)